jgi:hypothetical protein
MPIVHSAADDRGVGGWSSAPPEAAGRSAADRHTMAVRRSLEWAQDSADRGDYADALGWLGVLEAIGERLPAMYQTRRKAWVHALAGTDRNRRELD